MEKKFFDWEDDPELSSSSNIDKLPLTGDFKAEQDIKDLMDGYQYGKTGMLQKEIRVSKGPNIQYFDPDEVLLDEKGRKYFFNDDGYRNYLTDDGRLYYTRVTQDGVEEEYTVFKGGNILVFKNPEHTIGITDQGDVYQYDPETQTYVYDPQMIIFPDQHR